MSKPPTEIALTTQEAPRSSELAIRPEQTTFDDVQMAALRALGVEDAPEGDIKLLFHQAKRQGLDPFAKQIYLIGRASREKRGNQWTDGPKKWTIQTAIDGYRIIRDRNGTWQGQEERWCGEDGVWKDVWLSKKPPAAARILLYIAGKEKPVPATALWSEYAATDRDGNPQAMWKKMPAAQLMKCAEALALRKAYPQDLAGTYVDEEMQQADVGADGVPSVTRVPAARNGAGNPKTEPEQGIVEARGHASEARVQSEPDRDATRPADTRPGASRTVNTTGAGRPSAPHEDEHAVADEWADRARKALTVTDARDLYRDANHRGILGYPLTSGELLGDVLRARGEHLADEEAHAAEADVPLEIPADDLPAELPW